LEKIDEQCHEIQGEFAPDVYCNSMVLTVEVPRQRIHDEIGIESVIDRGETRTNCGGDLSEIDEAAGGRLDIQKRDGRY
jgi:hypothetical protein